MSLWTIWGPSVRVAVILSPCCSQGGDQNSFKIVCKHYHCPILLSATQWANKSKSQVFTCLPSRNSNPSRYKHYQWFSRKKLCFSPSQMFQKYCIYQSQFRLWVWQLFTPRSSWSAKSSESAIRKKKERAQNFISIILWLSFWKKKGLRKNTNWGTLIEPNNWSPKLSEMWTIKGRTLRSNWN